MKFKLLIGFLPILLTSCASVNSYHEPRTGSQPLATVSGSSDRNGLFTWEQNIINSIDDKSVGMVWSVNSKINVVPGPHLFVIDSSFNRGFNSGPYSSITEVRATLKPGMSYKFVGKPYGASLNVWAVDSHGQRVSEVGTSKYQYSPTTTYVTVWS